MEIAGAKNGNLLTVTQASKRLKVTEETVRRYIREGKLAATKRRSVGIKKVWFVESVAIDRFLEE